MAKKRKQRPATPRGMKASDLPLVIYAVKPAGADTVFGYTTFNEFEDGERVGVYDLREVRAMHVTRGLR